MDFTLETCAASLRAYARADENFSIWVDLSRSSEDRIVFAELRLGRDPHLGDRALVEVFEVLALMAASVEMLVDSASVARLTGHSHHASVIRSHDEIVAALVRCCMAIGYRVTSSHLERDRYGAGFLTAVTAWRQIPSGRLSS